MPHQRDVEPQMTQLDTFQRQILFALFFQATKRTVTGQSPKASSLRNLWLSSVSPMSSTLCELNPGGVVAISRW
ncbi:MAG: hypothetical protein HON04_17180 [Planctomicrobium sp.]|nr:hypothetical protein [Planctomicrobium sp.]